MAFYYLDFPMTIYATEVVEADSYEQAKLIAIKLADSYGFYEDKLKSKFMDYSLLWENLEEPQAIDADGVDASISRDDLLCYIDGLE